MVFKVAVIGAGPSGLTSIKACLDECMVPTCFESSDDMGGLWKFNASHSINTFWQPFCVYAPKLHSWNCMKRYTMSILNHHSFFFHYVFLPLETSSAQEVSEPNRASIYRSLTINVSKEMMCYSDFPIPAGYPNYMHHSKILTYFRMYAEHFKLMQYIRFQVTESTWAERSGSFSVLLQFKTIPTNQSAMCILDLSEERETGTRLFTHRKMGSGDWEKRRTGGEACLWCSHLLHWPLHLP